MSQNPSSGRGLVHGHVRATTPQQHQGTPAAQRAQLENLRSAGRGPQGAPSRTRRPWVHAPGCVNLHVASSNVPSYEALRKPGTAGGSPTPESENRESHAFPLPFLLTCPTERPRLKCQPFVIQPESPRIYKVTQGQPRTPN